MHTYSADLAKLRHEDLLRRAAAERLARVARTSRQRSRSFRPADLTADLASLPLFRGLSRRELGSVARHADRFTAPEGALLAREATPLPQFVVLARGVAEAEVDGRRVAMLGVGDHFGELTVLETQPLVPTVRAVTDVEGFAFGRRGFWDAVNGVPVLAVRLAANLGEELARSRALVPSGTVAVQESSPAAARDDAELCGSIEPSSSLA